VFYFSSCYKIKSFVFTINDIFQINFGIAIKAFKKKLSITGNIFSTRFASTSVCLFAKFAVIAIAPNLSGNYFLLKPKLTIEIS